MKTYKSITENKILKAEKYKKGMEDGFYIRKFLIFTYKQPYIYTNITGELFIEEIKRGDLVIYHETKERVFKGIYNKKIFKKFYKRIKI